MMRGIGVDIVSISRISDSIDRSGKVFLDKVFAPWEQQRAKTHTNPIAYYAMIFAGKEATFKTFAIGWQVGVQFNEIEIKEGDNGEPIPTLKGVFAQLGSERNVTDILLSLSHDGDYAIGTAALIGE
jgi:holo-[acyl-carrier protein] synthase